MTQTKQCQRCKRAFEVNLPDDQFSNVVVLMRKFCEPCGEIEAQEATERFGRELMQKRENEWLSICPPLYANTDITHEGLNAAFRDAALAWLPSASKGIGFMGKSGGGKTRMLFFALRKAFDAQMSVRFISHNAFSKLVIDAFVNGQGESREEARRSLDNLAKVKVLLIDDLGKAPSTERCDAEIEELIETRGARMLPTLWSANGYGEWLIKRFGADRGEPLVRRLAEFSTVIDA